MLCLLFIDTNTYFMIKYDYLLLTKLVLANLWDNWYQNTQQLYSYKEKLRENDFIENTYCDWGG